ncbi:MAG: DoxX family membrane protein [Patescibacteria group bacterium]
MIKIFLFVFSLLLPAHIASAHEAYVMDYNIFWNGMNGPMSSRAFDALKNPADLHLTIIIVVSVLVALGINFLIRLTSFGEKLHKFPERFSNLGPHFVRITIAIALFFSAWSNTFLGPELHGSLFAYPEILRITLFAISIMIAIGFLTELAAFVGIVAFVSSFFVFGPYIFTYLNYLGELIVLLLFGMRVFSVDKYLLGPLKRFEWFEKYETVIVRVLYGIALIYAGITVKLLHPELTIDVVNTWHLTQFHWLFPSDPLLVTFGAGIVESVIGMFIIFGFEMRLTILISLFYITLSLLYFRELVWPHLLLYGISFNLLVKPEVFTIDHFIFEKHRKEMQWWKRPFKAHDEIGKSSIK